MTTVIGYVRVSTSDQNVENQKQQITEAGYSVNRWFSDEAVSGAVKASDRPGFGELLSYVREGDTLIVIAIDRLGRNTIDVLSTVEMLQAKGVKVVSLREGFDLSTPVGKAMLTMMAGLASLEKDLIREVIPLPRRKLKSKYRKTLPLRYINRLVIENLVKRVAIIAFDLNSSDPFLRLQW